VGGLRIGTEERKCAAVKKILVIVLVLVVAVGALGYWRGWFTLTTAGKFDVHTDAVKFKQDREAFAKTVGEKAKALKARFAALWTKSEGLTGDDKAHAQKELADLKARHDRIEEQLKEIEDAGPDRFESVKEDLTKALEDVEKKIEALTNKLAPGKDR
jgi:chromosome segregation ATPase